MRVSIYCVLFLIANIVYSQEKTNLSKKEYLDLQQKFKATVFSNADSAFIYVARIEKSKNPLHKAFALGSKAFLLHGKSKNSDSKKAYSKAFEYLDKVPASNEKTKLHADLLNMGGLIDWKNTNYSEALVKYQKGKKLSQSIKDYPQILKFESNIALINGDVENFQSAISSSKKVLKILDEIKDQYTSEQLENEKANVYNNLGYFYENRFYSDKTKKQFLDSAEYFFKNTIIYSKGFDERKMGAQISLANLYYENRQYVKSEKMYYDLLVFAKERGLVNQYSTVSFNLGRLYFERKKYDDALAYFQKVDSVYHINKAAESRFAYSNYCQAKIYDSYKNAEKASYHSKMYLNAFEKNESKLNAEKAEVNYSIGSANFKKEIREIKEKNEKTILFENAAISFAVILFIVLLFVLFRNMKKRKRVEGRVIALIAEHKANLESNKNSLEETYSIKERHEDKMSLLSLDEEKENEIISKLIQLEKKRQYLNSDFTQQTVAKKIKTNTTYLSYVVNKRLGKTFSEYVNELKINYVINEMISNPTFRKYSTQAMAESVGYKNAISFTKTFSKRTGVTPVQFIKRLENDAN